MPYDPEEIVRRHAGGSPAYANGKALPPDAARAWSAVERATGRVGAAAVRDSARRDWVLEAWRDAARGRWAVLRPVHGDLEAFRASADRYRPDAYLPIAEAEWQVLALVAAGRDGGAAREDEEVASAAFRLVDRMVKDAHRLQLLGAAEDEDEE